MIHDWTMPDEAVLAQATPEDIENIRIECEKHQNELSKTMTDITIERNECRRRDIDLADKLAKCRQMMRELKLASSILETRFWQKKKGY